MKLRTEVTKEYKIKKGDTHHPIEFRLVNMHNLLPIDISEAVSKFVLLKDGDEVLKSDVNLEYGPAGQLTSSTDKVLERIGFGRWGYRCRNSQLAHHPTINLGIKYRVNFVIFALFVDPILKRAIL